MKKTKVFVAVPTIGTITDTLWYRLRDFERRYGDKIDFIYPTDCVQRIFHDFARNGMVEEFLNSEADILWFIDSDVGPPAHVLDLVVYHQHEWQVAGAPYPIFMGVPGEEGRQIVFTAYKKNLTGGISPSRIPYAGQDWVDGMGTGCMFIKREVFSLIKKPYFEFIFREEDRGMTVGEDLGFCMKLSELGIKFFTDYSMVCKHQKNVDLLEMNNYAISYSNKAVMAYDADVRDKVALLEGLVKRKGTPAPKSNLILA